MSEAGAALMSSTVRIATSVPIEERQQPASTKNTYNILSATFTVSADGTCRIDRQITTYQVNASDLPDASYLDITTPETLERMRRDERAMIAQKYPRHKLADDGTVFGAGQTIITPVLLKADLLAQYRVFEAKGWVEDFEGYKETLIVERDIDDRNRLNWLGNPNLVNQARVFAGKTQFIL